MSKHGRDGLGICLGVLVLFLVGGCGGGDGTETASVSYEYDLTADGWTSVVSECFDVAWQAGGGLGGGGGLRVTGDHRDSYQLVRAWTSAWPSTPAFFRKITCDVYFAQGALASGGTGLKIKDSSGASSTVYQVSGVDDLGGGWSRVELTPSSTSDLPGAHDDIGINLLIRTSGTTVEMYVDNLRGFE